MRYIYLSISEMIFILLFWAGVKPRADTCIPRWWVERGYPLDGGLSSYNTESLTMDNSG
jgi:hypothetical protein